MVLQGREEVPIIRNIYFTCMNIILIMTTERSMLCCNIQYGHDIVVYLVPLKVISETHAFMCKSSDKR